MKAKQKSFIGILAGLMIISAAAYGQTDRISGRVFDSDSNPIAGVTVTHVEANLSTITLADGSYVIMGITDPYCDDLYTVQASITGYLTSSVTYYELCDGGNQTINIWLSTDGSPLLVTNINDSGPGSLRQAILDANADPDLSYIHFNIPGPQVHYIQPLSELPTITQPLEINGFTQPGSMWNTNLPGQGFNTVPKVQLDGEFAGAGAEGLVVSAGDCEIRGLIINHFVYSGIAITSDNNLIIECFIGTDTLGNASSSFGNGTYGIRIYGADNNEIRNCVISGNGEVSLSPNIAIAGGSSQNRLFGNLIGTDLSGTNPVINTAYGIGLSDATNNTIGGMSDEDRNILFGGMTIIGATTTDNRVIGNYIGPDVTGLIDLEGGGGIVVSNGASNNEIGPGNVISGNPFGGVTLRDNQTNYNRVFGNYFGVAADGNTLMGNSNNNVQIIRANYNRIGGLSIDSTNVISGSSQNGISIDALSNDNDIVGNRIGTNASGSIAVGNQTVGISVSGTNNTIGPGNLISGNIGSAIGIGNAGGIKVLNNLIGVNAANDALLPNGGYGISIGGGTFHKIEGNTICGSSQDGIFLAGVQTQYNSIIANYIGTNMNSLAGLGNNDNGIRMVNGGRDTVRNNIISGNGQHGIRMEGLDPNGNSITGNKIGTTVDGMAALANGSDGIYMEGGSNTTIGGSNGEGNLISGNDVGINMMTSRPSHALILGNMIGTNANGSAAIPNGEGIRLQDPTDITIGGPALGDRNIISGNTGPGIWIFGPVTNTVVSNNYIGTDITGELALPNNIGIRMELGAEGNYIGAGTNGPGNLIAFNSTMGISLDSDQNYVLGNVIRGNGAGMRIDGDINTIGGPTDADRNYMYENITLGISLSLEADSNLIEGNYLGTDHEGIEDLAEGYTGIMIFGNDNVVRNNLVSGYRQNGIHISRDNPASDASRNWIEGNTIGLNASGDGYIPNGQGIVIDSAADNTVLRNVIAGNSENGIVVFDWRESRCVNNRISQNSIFNNGGLGIDLLVGDWGVTENDVLPLDPDTGPNNLQNFPDLESISFAEGNVTITGSLRSEGDGTYILEFFASSVGDDTGYGEGEYYLGSETVITDELGDALFETTLPIQGYGAQVITATATDEDGNTSEFSQVIGGVVNQVLNMPFIYTLNSDGLPTVSLADYQNAIRSSFETWNDIPTAVIQMDEAEESSDAKYASASDGINLISFQDDRFPFAKGVLAVTAKTIRISSGGNEAEILDADIVFNPDYIYDPVHSFAILADGDTETHAFDIQSVATHEIGHVLGMIHSGVYSSTMFFMLGYGTTERELDGDDMAWASYRYPGEDFQANHGLISGNITYGDIGDVEGPVPHPPVAGALVLAVNTDTEDQKMFHAYTDADGNYTVPIYMNGIATDEYWIYIQPLDGDVYGTALKPANISPYIYSHTMFTDFPEEFYDENESSDDDPTDGAIITVTAGNDVTGIDLITNRDLTAPTVIGTSLDEESVNVAVSPTVAIKFSEPVDIYSFDETTCYMETGGDATGGIYTLLADSTHIVLFKPVEALQYSSNYTLHIDGITDLKHNSLASAYTSDFTTLTPDLTPPTVYDVIPADGLIEVDVTKPVKVFFSKPMNKTSVESGFTLMNSSNQTVAGEYDWDAANKEMTYTPDYSLLEGTDYSINLTTQVTDLYDIAMENDASLTFSTVAVAEPQILYLGPADGSTGITVETPMVVKMSEPLDLTTITSTSFFLTDVGTAAKVNGSFEYLDDNRTLVFRPDQALKFNQLYIITLTSDISDISNPKQYLLNTTASFTTAPGVTVPQITYMEPPFGARGAQTTIVGSGFDPVLINNMVSFNGETATVTKATLESLTVNVPNLANDGPVTVTVNGLPSNNSFEFDVVLPNTDPSYNVIASSTSGSRTRAVVINPDAGYAYVTNWGDNTVTPIDISGYIPVPEDDIPVGIEPMDIDLNPAGTLAYVTNYLSNTVSVIGTEEGASGFHEVTKNIPVGYHPYGVAASSDKKVYVANNESEYVSVIDVDPTSGGFDHVIANLKTGSKNRSIVVTPDAGLILVCGDDGVTIIDRDPTSPTFNDVVAVASKGSSTRHITITPDAALALATTEEGVILIIDIFQPAGPEFGNVIASVTTGSRARNINISPDAMYVYITNPDDNTVSVYQLDYSIVPGYGASLNNALGLVHITTIEVGDKPYAIAGHPNSEYILVTHDSETGGVSKIGVEQESLDPIYNLNELIASVSNAIDNDVIASRFGNRLLLYLNVTKDRYEDDRFLSAILYLDFFIIRTAKWTKRGKIPEDLGDAWLEAAFRIREQMIKDLFDQWNFQKSTAENGPQIGSSLGEQMYIDKDPLGGQTLRLENRPNPFSDFTLIDFEIPDAGQAAMPVIMRVFNINGQVVKTLVHMDMAPGQYTVHWDCLMEGGGLAPDGIYLLELMVPTQRTVIRLSVVK